MAAGDRRPATPDRRGSLLDASPPEHMSAAAQQVWGGVVDVLVSSGVLRDVDLLAVEMLCEAYADFAQADAEIRNNWIMVTRSDGSQVPQLSRYTQKYDNLGNRVLTLHPAYAAKREASSAIRAWLNELGMTPAARARILGSVHGLPPEERGGSDSGGGGPAEHAFADVPTEDRNALREILQRRLSGPDAVPADIGGETS